MNGRHAAEIAKTKARTPGWVPYRWDVVGEGAGLLLTGSVPVSPVESRPKLWGAPEEVLVTAEEIAAHEARYEAETGKCATCDGTGQVWAGWSAETGMRYRPCSRKGCEGGTLKVTA